MARKKRKVTGFKKALKGLPQDVRQQLLAEYRAARQQNKGALLSPEQKEILAGGQELTKGGQGIAQGYVDEYQKFGPEDFGDYRAKIEDSVFTRLSQNMDQDYQNTRQAKEQELFNKGIPYSQDPNSRFQQELGGIDRRYDEAKLQARSQAATMGGEEMQRQFGIERGTAQQNLGEASAVQAFGSGMNVPYTPVTSPNAAYLGIEGMKNQQRQLDIQQQQVGIQQQAANNAANAASSDNNDFHP